MRNQFLLSLCFLFFSCHLAHAGNYSNRGWGYRNETNWPEFDPEWGLKESIYEEAQARFEELGSQVANQEYAVVIDFSKRSSKYRFFLFDLRYGTVERHITAHGSGSDPNGSGVPTQFSNRKDSNMSSLGAYITGETTEYKGLALLLEGVDSTNDNARMREILVHRANYVNEAQMSARPSHGCPALDPSVATEVINKIEGGSFLYIGH